MPVPYRSVCRRHTHVIKLRGEPGDITRAYGADLAQAQHELSPGVFLTAVYVRAGCIEVVLDVVQWHGALQGLTHGTWRVEGLALSASQVAAAMGLPPSAAEGAEGPYIGGDAQSDEAGLDVSPRVLRLGEGQPVPLRVRLSGEHAAAGWEALAAQGWELLVQSRGSYLPVTVRAAAAEAEVQAAVVVEIASLDGLQEGYIWVRCGSSAAPCLLYLSDIRLHTLRVLSFVAVFCVQVDLRCRGRPMASVPLLAVADARVAAELRQLQQRMTAAQPSQADQFEGFLRDLGVWMLFTSPQLPPSAKGDTAQLVPPSVENMQELGLHLATFAAACRMTALATEIEGVLGIKPSSEATFRDAKPTRLGSTSDLGFVM